MIRTPHVCQVILICKYYFVYNSSVYLKQLIPIKTKTRQFRLMQNINQKLNIKFAYVIKSGIQNCSRELDTCIKLLTIIFYLIYTIHMLHFPKMDFLAQRSPFLASEANHDKVFKCQECLGGSITFVIILYLGICFYYITKHYTCGDFYQTDNTFTVVGIFPRWPTYFVKT
jgi:hypothetical protein